MSESFENFESSRPETSTPPASHPTHPTSDSGRSVPPVRSESIDLIAAALAKAQAEFVQPEKNKAVTVKNNAGVKLYDFEYADYNAIVEAVRGPLSKHGIAFTHILETHGANFILATYLIHSSGQRLRSVWPIGNARDPKAIGGDMTYGKRYCLSALTGCVADDDADADPANTTDFRDRKPAAAKNPVTPKAPAQSGPKASISTGTGGAPAEPKSNAPEKPTSREPDTRLVTPEQTVRLWTIAKGKGWTEDQVKMYLEQKYRVGSTRALTRDQCDEFIAVVETKAYGPAFAAAIGGTK